ncbi:MAG: DUF1456 family protein [Proteobacteria bacterium]|nr:DUF1456 family protein [Pseudomonadota bacterium]
MTYNDIFRRIRYIFDLKDSKMVEIFKLADEDVSQEQVCDWLRKDDDEKFQMIGDKQLASFLDGFISEKRGERDGPPIKYLRKLNNNVVFMKIKIALNLKAEEILKIMQLAEFKISKHELSAFFRKQGHKHYRECKNQILRNFLQGLQLKYRDKTTSQGKADSETKKPVFQWKAKS